jgi:hypothetical protein
MQKEGLNGMDLNMELISQSFVVIHRRMHPAADDRTFPHVQT